MKKIFESIALGNLALKNRLIRAATYEVGCGKNGHITPALGEIYRTLADGGVGLILTGMMSASPNGSLSNSMIKIYADDFISKFRAIVDDVHAHGSKIVVQIAHCGIKANVLEQSEHPYAPSNFVQGEKHAKAMTTEEIETLIENFGQSALDCKLAGADGVEIHAGHGFLLNQFLSPYFNHRTDEYGGSIANRSRIVMQIYDVIRQKVGKDFPVMIKINYNDLVAEGNTGADCLYICQELDKRGIDAIEITSGISVDAASAPTHPASRTEAFFSDGAAQIAEHVSVPVISVGGYRSPAKIEEILNNSKIAAVSLCRALICEPDLPQRWEQNNFTASRCVGCNQCFGMPKLGCAIMKKR